MLSEDKLVSNRSGEEVATQFNNFKFLFSGGLISRAYQPNHFQSVTWVLFLFSLHFTWGRWMRGGRVMTIMLCYWSFFHVEERSMPSQYFIINCNKPIIYLFPVFTKIVSSVRRKTAFTFVHRWTSMLSGTQEAFLFIQ